MDGLLNFANQNKSSDQSAVDAIDTSNANMPVGESSENTYNIQQKILDWNPNALPEYGADGIMGDETSYWLKQYTDSQNSLASTQSSENINRLKNAEGRGGVAEDESGYSIPVYGKPNFSNRFG